MRRRVPVLDYQFVCSDDLHMHSDRPGPPVHDHGSGLVPLGVRMQQHSSGHDVAVGPDLGPLVGQRVHHEGERLVLLRNQLQRLRFFLQSCGESAP